MYTKAGTLLIVLTVLLSIGILPGCYSYHQLSLEERKQVLLQGDEEIRVESHGESLDLQPHHYLSLNEPAKVVFGVGRTLDSNGKPDEKFEGSFKGSLVDTGREIMHAGSYDSKTVTTYDFADEAGKRIRFFEGDVAQTDSTMGPGLWYCWRQQSFSTFEHREGMIPSDRINAVSRWRLDPMRTAVFGALLAPVAYVAAIVIISKLQGEDPFKQ